jgi:hypothetical protein
VPTARLLIERRVMQGQVPAQACTEVLRQLKGVEIFSDCAHVRNPAHRHHDLEQFCAEIGLPSRSAGWFLQNAANNLVGLLELLSSDFPPEMGALDRLLGETSSHINEILHLGIDIRERDAHVSKGGGWALS